MTLIKKILGIGWLFCCILLLSGGTSLAQTPEDQNRLQPQQQSPSTVDLESQANTYRYPRGSRRAAFPQPNNTATGDPDPPPNNIQPNNNIPAINPNSRPQPATPSSAPAAVPMTSTGRPPVPPRAIPPAQGFIGPPAPIPPTPEQMAPAAPKIAYQNGLLSVESVNARLIDILNGIHAKAGIQFEGMQGAQERVAGKFGPAPADEVLTSLLRGSRYDYVIIGMPANPALVQRVILSPTSGAPAVAGTPAAQPSGAVQQSEGDEDDSSEDTAAEVPQGQTPQPGLAQPLGTNTPKSTEQLLEELKRMQQQNQQNQQNQPAAPRKPTGPQ
jgi:hypothetical protein